MWERWFKQWLTVVFWWLPGKDRDAESLSSKQTRTVPQKGATETHAAPAEVEPAADSASPADDLTVIKGLGPAAQRNLAAVGVTTFDQLARADASTLTEKLKPLQPTVTKEKVGIWIKSARK